MLCEDQNSKDAVRRSTFTQKLMCRHEAPTVMEHYISDGGQQAVHLRRSMADD
jgi:hypothetical protein